MALLRRIGRETEIGSYVQRLAQPLRRLLSGVFDSAQPQDITENFHGDIACRIRLTKPVRTGATSDACGSQFSNICGSSETEGHYQINTGG